MFSAYTRQIDNDHPHGEMIRQTFENLHNNLRNFEIRNVPQKEFKLAGTTRIIKSRTVRFSKEREDLRKFQKAELEGRTALFIHGLHASRNHPEVQSEFITKMHAISNKDPSTRGADLPDSYHVDVDEEGKPSVQAIDIKTNKAEGSIPYRPDMGEDLGKVAQDYIRNKWTKKIYLIHSSGTKSKAASGKAHIVNTESLIEPEGRWSGPWKLATSRISKKRAKGNEEIREKSKRFVLKNKQLEPTKLKTTPFSLNSDHADYATSFLSHTYHHEFVNNIVNKHKTPAE